MVFGIGQSFIDEMEMTQPALTEAKFRSGHWEGGHQFETCGRVPRIEYERVAAWCEENFGRPMITLPGLARWEIKRGTIYRDDTTRIRVRFRWENDAFAFKMRWC